MEEDIIARIISLLDPIVRGEGLELWDVEFSGGHGSRVLRVFIDKEGGVTVEDCANVSRQAGLALDAEDIISDRYMLEVSSPGLTRALKKPQDFTRAVGKLAVMKIRHQLHGSNRVLAVITAADVNGITVTIKETGETAAIPYQDIAKANLEVEF